MSASAAHLDIADYSRPKRATARRLSFLIFNAAHPEVLTRLVRLAREKVAAQRSAGRKPKVGMRALWERLRWDMEDSPVVQGTQRPRLNNNLAPEYARWISENCGDLADVFEFRGDE